jgi:hypothetical protein
VALVKQQKINNPHCFWSDSTKKIPKIYPNQRLSTIRRKNKQMYLFAYMNWPLSCDTAEHYCLCIKTSSVGKPKNSTYSGFVFINHLFGGNTRIYKQSFTYCRTKGIHRNNCMKLIKYIRIINI